MGKPNRDRQWANIRRVEWVYVALTFALISGLFAYALLGPPSDVVFWVLSGAAMVVGQGIWVRQYQVLDELGRLRFLKSWMVSGMVTVSGLAWVMLWATYQGVRRARTVGGSGPPEIPFWPIYLCLIAGLLAMGLTNLYLRRRDDRGE